ncbi:hypothetical protein [Acinetobacter baretiae]|uniref:hypothetical protein n=1 Tax=Acinetobacter baretiae TaxID=2605383 RepID=UPI001F2F71CB|nr:hypothetical protein [Acinetobacter baretiae]
MMYAPHPNKQLHQVFSEKPYQGCCPIAAEFLFIGLDANYASDIENQLIFPKLIEYHQDAVLFWKRYGLHHPFLLDSYKGSGRKYHKEFAKIGISAKYADKISFIEVLHVPTTGRNVLTLADLNDHHLDYIKQAIFSQQKKAVFMSDTVFRLLKKTTMFAWLNDAVVVTSSVLKVFHQPFPMIYKHLHFSTYGKFQVQKEAEMKAIFDIICQENKC